MSYRQALLLSSTKSLGLGVLQHAKEEICSLFQKHKVSDIICFPDARIKGLDRHTSIIKHAMEPWGVNVIGIQGCLAPANIIKSAKAIYMGGGNTFYLLNLLYGRKIIDLIRERVDEGSLLYIGSSAGSVVASAGIYATNDMPIVHPPSFEGIGIVPFVIHPHFHDNATPSTPFGKNRIQRIMEYMDLEKPKPVLALREGSILKVDGNSLTIKGVESGNNAAAVFKKGENVIEYPVGADISWLL